MMRTQFVLLPQHLSIVLLLSGCAAQELHYWGDYETSLYGRYVENKSQETEEDIKSTLLEAESQHKRIAPGVNADYGFMLYKRGDMAGAMSYFEKEKKLYPESSALMVKLIERIQRKAKPEIIGSGGK